MKHAKKKLKKFFPTFIASIPHQKHVLTNAVKYTIFISLSVFLLFNILLSQLISPVYFQVMNDDQKAALFYLQSIRKLPQYINELSKFKNMYGNNLEKALSIEESSQKDMIQKYEQILEKSPYSRDISYSLFFLYGKIGNKKIAQEYFQRAKEVDPDLK